MDKNKHQRGYGTRPETREDTFVTPSRENTFVTPSIEDTFVRREDIFVTPSIKNKQLKLKDENNNRNR